MADFCIAFDITNGNEGGWQNDPNDRGNAPVLGTYRGIASAMQPGWKGWPTVKAAITNMTAQPHYGSSAYYAWVKTLNGVLAANAALQAVVRDFYCVNFWDVNRLGDLTSQEVANQIYDHGVNRGVGTAAIILQKCLGVIADGNIGPVTIAAANKLSSSDMESLYRNARKSDYLQLIAKNPKLAQYESTWLARC